MLKKFLLSLVLIIIILFFSIYIYAETYFKLLLKNQIEKINSLQIVKITYDDLSIKLNHLSPKFNINNLKINYDKQNYRNQIKFSKIDIESNLIFSDIKIIFPEIIDISTKSDTQNIQYMVQPVDLNIINLNLGQALIFRKDIELESFLKNFISINLDNFNIKIINKDISNKFTQVDLDKIKLSQSVLNDTRTLKFISNINYKSADKTPFKIDSIMSLNLIKKDNISAWYEFGSYQFDIDQFDLNILNENLKIDGKLNGDMDELMPNGQVKFTIDHLEDFYDNVKNYYKPQNKQEEFYKESLLNIFNEITDNGKTNVLEIKRSKFGQIYVNNKNIVQIFSYLNEDAANQ